MVKAPKGYYTILDFMTMNEFERNVALSEFRNMLNRALTNKSLSLAHVLFLSDLWDPVLPGRANAAL